MNNSAHTNLKCGARDGEVASVVIIAEVVGIIVEEQVTKTGPDGDTGIDTTKLQPVKSLLYQSMKQPLIFEIPW